MAVVIEAFDVVARVDVVPGGIGNFRAAVPNATFCTDRRLVRASFMTEADRERFIESLGLADTSGVAVLERRTPQDACPGWIAVGRYGGVYAAWLRGEDPEPLVIPVSWRPGEIVYSAAEVREHLDFLGREGGIEVYRDKRTGKRVYTGRTGPSLDDAQAARFSELRREANDL